MVLEGFWSKSDVVSFYQRWRFALKPASWPKLFVPAFLGQAIGATHRGGLDLVPAIAGMVLTFLMLVFIVLMNDVADQEVDAIKRRRFPQTSRKTIIDGVLPGRTMWLVAIVGALSAMGFAWYCEGWLNRPATFSVTMHCLTIFCAYSLWPFRLNYRGGGELLEMLGTGFALPWLNAYLQGGLGVESITWLPRPWAVLVGMMALGLASAVASGLSDEVSDREGGKRTFVTMFGNPMARRLTEALVVLGCVFWGLAGLLSPHVPVLAVLLPIGIVLWNLRTMRAISTSAVTNAFEPQKRYKEALHKAIWSGAQWLGMLLLGLKVFFG